MQNILVTGANSQLGKCLKDLVYTSEYIFGHWIFCDHNELDITNKVSIENAFNKYLPNIVINCAAYTNVEKAEDEFLICNEVNCIGVQYLVDICQEKKVFLVHISSDYVYKQIEDDLAFYDITNTSKNLLSFYCFHETNELGPINKYGISKALGDIICSQVKGTMIIRTSWLYSEYGNNFVKTISNKLLNNDPLKVINDQIGRPTNAHDLANFIAYDIVKRKNFNIEDNCIIYNYQNEGEVCSWYEFAVEISKNINKTDIEIIPVLSTEFKTKAIRPQFSAMNVDKVQKILKIKIPQWKDSLRHFLKYNYKFSINNMLYHMS